MIQLKGYNLQLLVTEDALGAGMMNIEIKYGRKCTFWDGIAPKAS